MRSSKTILIFLIPLSFLSTLCFANSIGQDTTNHLIKKHQKKHPNWPKILLPAPADKVYYKDCVFIHKFTTAQRLAKYPYNKATKILAISFDGTGEPNVDFTATPDSIKQKRRPHGLHFNNGILDTSNLFEIRQLNHIQIARLTNIMMNTSDRIPNNYADINSSYACFNPRNGFIFIDKNGKAFDYLEICFECNGMRSKSDRIYFNSDCIQDLELIRKFLISTGIKFGTTTTDTSKFN